MVQQRRTWEKRRQDREEDTQDQENRERERLRLRTSSVTTIENVYITWPFSIHLCALAWKRNNFVASFGENTPKEEQQRHKMLTDCTTTFTTVICPFGEQISVPASSFPEVSVFIQTKTQPWCFQPEMGWASKQKINEYRCKGLNKVNLFVIGEVIPADGARLSPVDFFLTVCNSPVFWEDNTRGGI